MSGWTVPLSSSPPSTPGTHQQNTSGSSNPFTSFAPDPSTTPAGPPPSSAASFTPAGVPTSSVFGSSYLSSGNTLFRSEAANGCKTDLRRDPSNPFSKALASNGAFKGENVLSSSLPSGVSGVMSEEEEYGVSEEYYDEDDDPDESRAQDDSGESEEGSMEVDSDAGNQSFGAQSTTTSQFNGSLYGRSQNGSSFRGSISRQIKESCDDAPTSYERSLLGGKEGVKRKDSALPGIIKSMAKKLGVTKLEEPDNIILQTEELVSELHQLENKTAQDDRVLEAALTTIPEALSKLWRKCCKQGESRSELEGERVVGIGPNENAPPFQKATFVGTLLLQLHHPPAAKGKQAFAAFRRSNRSSLADSSQVTQLPSRSTAIPRVLFDWLHDHHNYRTSTAVLHTHQPNSTAHPEFWDFIFYVTLRGRISEVVRILKEADFKYARTARNDGQAQDGYHVSQIGNINRVVSRAIQVLELCPSLQDGDWNVTDHDWFIFRKRVEQATADLATFAEGRDRDLDPAESVLEAENFGLRGTSKPFSQSTRRVESKVPWTIYRSLKTMYGILLGGTTEIISTAHDWVEATVGLTAWWNGDDDDEISVGSLVMTRHSLRQSQSRVPRSVDVNPVAAYLRRLVSAFERITDDSDDDAFQINSNNPVEVGLASIFEGNVEGVIGLLRGWSLPVATAVAEVASHGNWFEPVAGSGMMDGFDESDLMVLSYGQSEDMASRDSILMEYAGTLFEKEVIEDQRTGRNREGWELSVQILSRLDDSGMASKKVGALFNQLPLDSDWRVDKLLEICSDFGMIRESRDISERYADSIAGDTDRYGTALIYYARAHSKKKVKDVLDLLISVSLVQSLAFPPHLDLDQNLMALVFSPKESLQSLVEMDHEAADVLLTYLSGYATLRKFYDLRDEGMRLPEGQKSTLRPMARKRAAAAALLAVIDSAADNIHGGLYDEDRGSVVQVDGLLVLLGEALIFVDQPKRILSDLQNFTLLKAIEDLETVASRVYAQCNECFQSTMAAAHGARAPLKKSVSSMTASSGFSMVGSSLLDSGTSVASGRSSAALGTAGEVKRGWDWRKGLGKEARGEDILRILRLGLAKDMTRAWVEGNGI